MDGKKSDVDPDPSLDFLSAKFDPLLALRVVSTDIRLPYPDVQACYSLDAYKSIMRARGSGRPARHAAPPEASDELVLPERKEKPAKAVKTVLTYMQCKRLLLMQFNFDVNNAVIVMMHVMMCTGAYRIF